MKTLLIACLCSLALTLTSLAQSPAPPQTAPPGLSPAASPGAPAAASPGAPAAVNPAAPAQLPTGSAPPGVPAAPGATITATLSPAPTARIEKVFTAIETGDVTEASRLSRGSRDPVLRMMWNGLNHQHASLQGALQVAAGIEIKRAGRFLVVMDTLVTLAPLLGLLGTITGLIRSFSFLGNEELAVQAVTGGIAEALIATACGLGIAIFSLVPFNFFTSRVSNLEFELQTAATNLEVMLGAQTAAREMEIAGPTPTTGKGSSI